MNLLESQARAKGYIPHEEVTVGMDITWVGCYDIIPLVGEATIDIVITDVIGVFYITIVKIVGDVLYIHELDGDEEALEEHIPDCCWFAVKNSQVSSHIQIGL